MRTRVSPAAQTLALVLTLSTTAAFAQGGAAGQGGLSPDTPVIARQPPGASTQPQPAPSGGAEPAPAPGAAQVGPKTPLPPRDTPRAQQPGQSVGGDGPKTPLPPRDTPRAQQPGQKSAAVQNPDWPCVQVKVPTMSYGQMWSGPALDAALKSWRDDKQVADLADYLVARRTKIEDAKAAIDKFAKEAGETPDAKLTLLFAGVFDELNAERSQIITGIERYSRKQRALSERIKDESLKMASNQQDMAAQMSPESMKQQETLDWDTRIYEERSQSLTYVCETPVILEQRAFDLGREIQTHLSQAK